MMILIWNSLNYYVGYICLGYGFGYLILGQPYWWVWLFAGIINLCMDGFLKRQKEELARKKEELALYYRLDEYYTIYKLMEEGRCLEEGLHIIPKFQPMHSVLKFEHFPVLLDAITRYEIQRRNDVELMEKIYEKEAV